MYSTYTPTMITVDVLQMEKYFMVYLIFVACTNKNFLTWTTLLHMKNKNVNEQN